MVYGIQEAPLTANCTSTIELGRALTYTDATNTVAYTSAGTAPDAISVSKSVGGTVAFKWISQIDGTVFVKLAGTVAVGDELEVSGSYGEFIKKSGTGAGIRAFDAGVDGDTITAYKKG